jgi:hypothetical protein
MLNIPLIASTRRYHALEHATIQMLNLRFPVARLIGWSTPAGFYISGPVSAEDVRAAVTEAIVRLQRGESHLAIHPRCGTNLVTAGTLVGLVAFLTMLPGDLRSRRERLPLVLLLSTLATLFAQPLGLLVQQYVTTEAHLGRVLAVQIDTRQVGRMPVYHVQFGSQVES